MAAKKKKMKKMKQKWAAMEEEMMVSSSPSKAAASMERKKRDEELFVVDTATTTHKTSANAFAGVGALFITKKQRARMKTLRVDSILRREKVEKSYPKPTKHRAVDGNVAVMKKKEKEEEEGKKTERTLERADEQNGVSLWEKHFPRATGIARQAMKILRPTVDRKHAKPVQVDEAGCSYNPPEDLRNEVIMKAAAKEIAKDYKEQLNPVRPPLLGQKADALRIKELYYETGFGDEDDEDEDEDDEGKVNAKKNKSAANTSEKLNKAARNKRARHQQLQKEIEERKQLKKQRRDLSELKSITKDIAEKEKRDEMKRHRLHLTRKEREETQPRRLGKHKYEEDLPEVLFTEQVNGNLRTLHGAHALLKDRLKSYQRRELIEPRKRQIKKKSKMLMKYEPGARDRIFAPPRDDDLQPPVDIPFAPIDKYPAISNLQTCWSFFFTSSSSSSSRSLPSSCLLKQALSETLRYFPLSMKVVDWPAMPSLSGREQCGVYWKEVDVLYHQEEKEEKEEEEEKKRIMERVERKTKPLKIPRRTCMAVQKTNVRSFTKNDEEEWEVLTFFVKHYACDGDSMKTFLSFFCRIIQEQEEQRQRLQQREYLLSKRRLSEIHLPTSKRLEYFKLSEREEMKVKEYGEFIAYPELVEHGCVKVKPSRALRGILVGGLKFIFSKSTRIQIKLSETFIREMKERTTQLAPVEDYVVEDDYVSSNDIATALCWKLLSLVNERKEKKKKSTKKKPSYANIAINYRNYGVLPRNYFGNASFAHIIAVDDVYASVEKRAREIRRSLQKYREGDSRMIDSRTRVRLALGSLDNISFREHLISLHSMLNSLDLSATNWMTFDFYNLEFGRGVKATQFDGYVTPRVPNSCAIFPTRAGDGCTLMVEMKKNKVRKAVEIVRRMFTLDDADNS
ncbi:unnamed protein product [Bathycoccus prasinos]